MAGGRRQLQDTHTRYICILWLLLLPRSRLATFHCCWPLIRRGRGIKTATVAATTTTPIVLNEEKADKWSWQRLLRPFWPFSSCCCKLNAQPRKPNRNRRILRFSSSVCHVVFSLLSPHSWFHLSLSSTHRQTEMFPNYFSYNFICILLSRISSCFSGSSCWQVKPAKKKGQSCLPSATFTCLDEDVDCLHMLKDTSH